MPTSQPFDPILDVSNEADRFVIGDVENEEAYLFYKRALACFWVSESIDLATDYTQFSKLKKDEQHFLLKVLGFFAGSDGIVLENIICNFYSEVKQAEIRLFYGLQICIENIHSEVYTDLIASLEKDKKKREDLFKSIDKCSAVKSKADWATRWLKSDASFGERLIAFACVEGILFSASFCAIFWFRKRGYDMPGLYQSNEYISRDEALHCQFAVLIYKQLKEHNKIDKERIKEIVISAVEVEKTFVDEALKKPIIGMNAKAMLTYVKFVADGLLRMLDCERHFNVENPFQFMNTISMENKSNFFERRVTEYSLAGVKTTKATESNNIVFKVGDEDF